MFQDITAVSFVKLRNWREPELRTKVWRQGAKNTWRAYRSLLWFLTSSSSFSSVGGLGRNYCSKSHQFIHARCSCQQSQSRATLVPEVFWIILWLSISATRRIIQKTSGARVVLGSKLGKQFSRIQRLEMMYESGRKFATAVEALLTRATVLQCVGRICDRIGCSAEPCSHCKFYNTVILVFKV